MPGNESLKSLHTTLIDAEKGYDTAIVEAETPDMLDIFGAMRALHAKAHADVHAILVARGERPDESGSFMSLVNETVISVRSAVAVLDRSSLPSFVEGEERIVDAYDQTLAETGATDPAAETLRKNRDALVAAISDMRAKAA